MDPIWKGPGRGRMPAHWRDVLPHLPADDPEPPDDGGPDEPATDDAEPADRAEPDEGEDALPEDSLSETDGESDEQGDFLPDADGEPDSAEDGRAPSSPLDDPGSDGDGDPPEADDGPVRRSDPTGDEDVVFHLEDDEGPTPGTPPRRPGARTPWSIPLLATAIALCCILLIALPAALTPSAGDSEPPETAETEAAEVGTTEADATEADAADNADPKAADATTAEDGGDAKADDADAGADADAADDASATTGGDEALLAPALELGTDYVERAEALSRAISSVDRAAAALDSQGFPVGYYVATIDGQEILAHNADRSFYGASSIKGPFVLRAFPQGVPEEYRPLVHDAIQQSDNEAYHELRDDLGYEILADQLEGLGVEGFSPYQSFVWMTPRQLAALWVQNYDALTQKGPEGDWLRETFSHTDNSTLGTLKADRAWSKGGWLETEDLHATVDAGIVVHGESTYVMAVMTDKGEDFEALGKVVQALDATLVARAALLDPEPAD